MRKIAVIFTLIICIATSVVAMDIHHDRAFKITIIGDALLLENPYPIGHNNEPNRVLQVLPQGEEANVLRIME